MALSSAGSRGENSPGRVAVPLDLGGELFPRGEMRLVAQLLHELDGETGTVEVAREIEEERFERGRAVFTHGRVGSQARHSLESASCCTVTFYRIDAGEGRLRPAEADVGRGKSQQATALVAMHHVAGDGVAAAEEARRQVEVAGGERIADSRAGNP